MSSSTIYTSKKRYAQSKTLTVSVFSGDKFKVSVTHYVHRSGSIIRRQKIYTLNKIDSFADRTLHNYLHTMNWRCNLVDGQIEVSRDHTIERR